MARSPHRGLRSARLPNLAAPIQVGVMVWTTPHGIWLNEGPCQNGCRKSNRLRERRPWESLSPICRPSRPWGSIWPSTCFRFNSGDGSGRVVVATAIRRSKLLALFASLPPCRVGLEASGSAHHWARELIKLGHDARMMPPAYVKPYIRRQKNDAADAEAICEAVTTTLDAICRRALAGEPGGVDASQDAGDAGLYARSCSTRCAVT